MDEPAAQNAVPEPKWLKCDNCGQDMRGHDRMGHCQPAAQSARDELAACLRGAVTAMEILEGTNDARYLPGLPDLIERSKAALKEYDK